MSCLKDLGVAGTKHLYTPSDLSLEARAGVWVQPGILKPPKLDPHMWMKALEKQVAAGQALWRKFPWAWVEIFFSLVKIICFILYSSLQLFVAHKYEPFVLFCGIVGLSKY